MSERIYNFSAGPGIIPIEVLKKAQGEMLSVNGIGMSVMEISHRSNHFAAILEHAVQGIRDVLHVPENYKVLFLQGGPTLQFSMLPMNFLQPGGSADYVLTGYWGNRAINEAEKCGKVNVIYSDEANGFKTFPAQEDLRFTPGASYIHYTSNETIDGVEFDYDMEAHGTPVICDASSNIMSKPMDIEKSAIIYAGAQKNIGPSGVTLVIIREDMLEKVPQNMPSMLDYRALAENDSMVNTPNTWGIYFVGLVCDWLKTQGGIEGMAPRNAAKAKIIYDAIDASDGYYEGHAERNARSDMNVTFHLGDEELENMFCTEATRLGLDGLKGHRSVGGIRASIYNAFPKEGCERLVDFMKDFAERHG